MNRELVALYYCCSAVVSVACLLLEVTCVGLWFVTVALPGHAHAHLLFEHLEKQN